MIRATSLIKTYTKGHQPAVDDISFSVEKGEFYTLLGPSGCGKTTTLRCIAGLERLTSGTIELGEVMVASDRLFVPPHRREIGMVFQSYAIWPHMTVFDNVAYPLQVGPRITRGEIRRKVLAALSLVGMETLEKRMATQLSGGQQQRLALARALVREPAVLLLDEPLSNLDAKLRERMRSEILEIQRRVGITTIFVTHDQVEALSMSDRIAVMNRGKIVQEGHPREIYHQPKNEFVINFIGSVNTMSGRRVPSSEGFGAALETPIGLLRAAEAPASHATEVVVAFRPEDVVVTPEARDDGGRRAPNGRVGRIELSMFEGTLVTYHVEVGGTTIRTRLGSRAELRPGDRVVIDIPPEAVRVFEIPPEVGASTRRGAEGPHPSGAPAERHP